MFGSAAWTQVCRCLEKDTGVATLAQDSLLVVPQRRGLPRALTGEEGQAVCYVPTLALAVRPVEVGQELQRELFRQLLGPAVVGELEGEACLGTGHGGYQAMVPKTEPKNGLS